MVARLDFPVSSPADFAALRREFQSLPLQPKVLQSREGGIDISSPGRESFTLLVGEETGGRLYSGDVRLMPEFGAPPHHQPTEDELWYLLEGELDARVGNRRATLHAGAFAYIPRNTTHAFRNNSKAPARLLTWNAPGGHERAFEEMRGMATRGITAFPELKGMFRAHEIWLHADEQESTAQDSAPGPTIVSQRSEGKDVSWPGADARLLLDGAASRGDFEVLDVFLQRGAGMPMHADPRSDKCFYFLAGRVDLTVEAGRHSVGRGAFAFIPRGTRFSLADAGGEPVHFLLWSTPAKPGNNQAR